MFLALWRLTLSLGAVCKAMGSMQPRPMCTRDQAPPVTPSSSSRSRPAKRQELPQPKPLRTTSPLRTLTWNSGLLQRSTLQLVAPASSTLVSLDLVRIFPFLSLVLSRLMTGRLFCHSNVNTGYIIDLTSVVHRSARRMEIFDSLLTIIDTVKSRV